MHSTAIRRFAWIVVVSLLSAASLVRDAAASGGTCARKRMPPGQNLFWVCVTEGATCGTGCNCKTVSYGGIVPYSTCECLPSTATGNDFDYSTGGSWLAPVDFDPAPHTTLKFTLSPGVGNGLVIYPDEDVIESGEVANEQVFTGSGDLSGSFSVALGMAIPDSIPCTITDLNLTVTSFSYEGDATGTNSIVLAADGPAAHGWFRASTGTIQFDEPVHCTVTNSLHGTLDYYFRPILTQAMDGLKSSSPTAVPNPFTLLPTGRFVPPGNVPVQHDSWGRMKRTYR